MNTVRIVTPIGSGPEAGFGTRVEMPDGTAIPWVRKVTIHPLESDRAIVAEIELCVSLANIHAVPLLALDSVRDAADAHGYRLEPKG